MRVRLGSEMNQNATVDDLSYRWMRKYLVRTNASEDAQRLSKLNMTEAMGPLSVGE